MGVTFAGGVTEYRAGLMKIDWSATILHEGEPSGTPGGALLATISPATESIVWLKRMWGNISCHSVTAPNGSGTLLFPLCSTGAFGTCIVRQWQGMRANFEYDWPINCNANVSNVFVSGTASLEFNIGSYLAADVGATVKWEMTGFLEYGRGFMNYEH
jgi:hypothetical protein